MLETTNSSDFASLAADTYRTPLHQRFAALLAAGGELQEVAPRRYCGPDGAVHYFAAMCMKRAISSGILEQVQPGRYRMAQSAMVAAQSS